MRCHDFEVNVVTIEQCGQKAPTLPGKLLCFMLLPGLAAFGSVFRAGYGRAAGRMQVFSPQCNFTTVFLSFPKAHHG